MNLEHAIQTIAKRGFTERQARFLVLVARHSGVCVMRQYSTFAGIVFGQKTRKFFANLVRVGFVSTYDRAHNRGRVYHVRHRAIYEAIGEPDSRLRRPPGVPRALERLMLLDAILENFESIWMSSSAEKVEYLSSRGSSPRRRSTSGHSTGRSATAPILPRSPPYWRPSIWPRRPRLRPRRPAARRVPRLPPTSRATTRAASRLDDPNRSSGAFGVRGAGPAEGRVGAARVAAPRPNPDRAALVLRALLQPSDTGEPG
jgi:hypothetical protein